MLTYIENKLKNGENIIIYFVGDSITYGLNHCTAEETYVAFLAKMLAKRFPNSDIVRYDGIPGGECTPLKCYEGPFAVSSAEKRSGSITLIRSGVGGNTVQRAINRAQDFCLPFIKGKTADIYFTMFGINDSLIEDKRKYILPERFYENYKRLCEMLKDASPDARLVLMTPTYNDFGDSEKSRLDPYCEQVKKLANELGARLIDTHRPWMEHLIVGSEHSGQREWLSTVSGDHCHFSPEGSYATAKFIFENL